MFKSSGDAQARSEGSALMPALARRDLLIQASYFVAAVLFILGLKRMSSPVTARSGILWAGAGMLVATLVTFLYPGMTNYALIVAGHRRRRRARLVERQARRDDRHAADDRALQRHGRRRGRGDRARWSCIRGEARGSYATLDARGGRRHHRRGVLQRQRHRLRQAAGAASTRSFRFRGQQFVNLLLLVGGAGAGRARGRCTLDASPRSSPAFFVLALLLGVTMTLPIGGADMPVVISLYNALTGLAVALRRLRAATTRR